MSTSVSSEKCPKCGHPNSLYVDYDCKTGEYDTFCEFCGFGQHYSWQRDEKTLEIIRKPVAYPISEVYLGVRDYQTEEMLMLKPVTEIDGFDTDKMIDYINHADGHRFDEFENGFNNFYWVKDGEHKQLFYLGNTVEVTESEIIINEIQDSFESFSGWGHILMFADNFSKEHRFEEGTTKEEAMKVIEEALKDKNITNMFASLYNPETGEYELIYGEFSDNEDIFYNEEDSSISEDCLPF